MKSKRFSNLLSYVAGTSGDVTPPCHVVAISHVPPMHHTETPLHGLILAGGKSLRMGSDKASLLHPDGRTLGRRGVELLHGAGCISIAMSIRSNQAIPAGMENAPPFQVLRDGVTAMAGPMAGIVTAIKSSPEADWLVIACDLPNLETSDLTFLIRSKPDNERLLAYQNAEDGKPEPLCAIYGAGIIGDLEKAISMGIASPREFLLRNQCKTIRPPFSDALANANSKEEWRAIQAKAERDSGITMPAP